MKKTLILLGNFLVTTLIISATTTVISCSKESNKIDLSHGIAVTNIKVGMNQSEAQENIQKTLAMQPGLDNIQLNVDYAITNLGDFVIPGQIWVKALANSALVEGEFTIDIAKVDISRDIIRDVKIGMDKKRAVTNIINDINLESKLHDVSLKEITISGSGWEPEDIVVPGDIWVKALATSKLITGQFAIQNGKVDISQDVVDDVKLGMDKKQATTNIINDINLEGHMHGIQIDELTITGTGWEDPKIVTAGDILVQAQIDAPWITGKFNLHFDKINITNTQVVGGIDAGMKSADVEAKILVNIQKQAPWITKVDFKTLGLKDVVQEQDTITVFAKDTSQWITGDFNLIVIPTKRDLTGLVIDSIKVGASAVEVEMLIYVAVRLRSPFATRNDYTITGLNLTVKSGDVITVTAKEASLTTKGEFTIKIN
ncbi:hypothetical protein [Williamsoniiplasma lucivorax]|uniref:Lipoprotein n=1 Tax=Williamsoniiplasma lucivorax TaxID=209274 RepID=A0A2S5RAH0_9MOLU|nr:hypothetical protein [Williamsoniiplasma lucivorax]PPE04319.1 hypothetical protein ELUCI_v1c08400 [Williamsoniiplasma lucivorax]